MGHMIKREVGDQLKTAILAQYQECREKKRRERERGRSLFLLITIQHMHSSSLPTAYDTAVHPSLELGQKKIPFPSLFFQPTFPSQWILVGGALTADY